MKLTGIIPALLTPFDKNGGINTTMVRDVIDFHVACGATGEYVGGSTGEGFLLTEAERRTLAEAAVAGAKGRIPIVVQVGGMNLDEACRLAAHAEQAGAAGISSVPPFYYSVGLEGIKRYYGAICAATRLPVYIYNIPGATGVNVTPAMFKEIVDANPNMVGMKFTSYNFFEMRQIIDLDVKGRKLNVVSGPDEMMVAAQAMGADGAIGSTYNVLCKWFVDMYNAFHAGDLKKAADMQGRANKVIATFLGFPSFAALKEMMSMLGYDLGSPRLPLPPLSDAQKQSLHQKLDEVGFMEMAKSC